MSMYRKVDAGTWNDEKFRRLSDDGKLVFLYLLTGPGMTSLGAMRGSPAGLADEYAAANADPDAWPVERFLKAFGEVSALGMVEFDRSGPVVALPNFLRFNQPQSANVVTSWTHCFNGLPACDLKTVTLQRAKACAEGISESFAKAFMKAFAQPLAKATPNHKHELHPEQFPTAYQGEAEVQEDHVGPSHLRMVGNGEAA